MTPRVDSSRTTGRALALLAVLAPTLGGSTAPWARGGLLLATALVLFVWPPRRLPHALWLGIAAALAGWGLTGFLPAGAAAPQEWRTTLEKTLEVPLPGFVSPQPWLTLEAWGFLLAGLVFSLALLAHPWHSADRRHGTQIYAIGILALATLAMLSLALKWPVPWWPTVGNSGSGFGFFPNRNQTANVLALAGVMIAALGWEALNRHRRHGHLWFAGLVIVTGALVLAYSRAGIALFFGGTVAWVLLSLGFSASKKSATLAFAAVLVLLAGFFLFGGDTLQRFHRQSSDGRQQDFRVEVHRDARNLAALRPWVGQGLGNFEPVFNVSRAPTHRQVRALHPESDWLWGAVEMGWPAVALVGAALLAWALRTLPFDSGSDRYLRSAAAVCAVLFALHGLVDVSGHRAGSLWPALLLAALALRTPHEDAPENRLAAPLFRTAAVALAIFGAWWIFAAAQPARTLGAPTSATLAWLERRVDEQIDAGDYLGARSTADAALRIAPLQWRLYFQRAVTFTTEPEQFRAALDDFDRARFLEPRWVPMCLTEARLWLALNSPDVAFDSWLEALRRAGPEAPAAFQEMLSQGWSRPSLRERFAELALTRPDFLTLYLGAAFGLDFKPVLQRYLESDPELQHLDDAQRRTVLRLWFQRGDREEFLTAIAARPAWLEEGWPWVAEHYAQKQDFERAWSFVERYAPPPALPNFSSSRSLAESEREFHYHPENVQAGLELFFALRKLRQTDEALATLRLVEAVPGRPDYVLWLQAGLLAEKRSWDKAWAAFQKYQRTAQN